MKEENGIICGKCGTMAQIEVMNEDNEWYCPICYCTTILQNNFYPCCKVCLSPIIPIVNVKGFLDGICSNPYCLGYRNNYESGDSKEIVFSSLFFDFSIVCNCYYISSLRTFHINIDKYHNPKKYNLGNSSYHHVITKIEGNYIEKFLIKVFKLCEK